MDIEDEMKELRRIEEAAEAGDTEWQMELASWYEEHSIKEKLRLSEPDYARHTEKTRAQVHIIKDLRAKMLYWYKKAAQLGNHEAQYKLWLLGGKEDSSLLEQAVAGGHYEALFEIGAEDDALKNAPTVEAENRILFRYGKKLFESAKSDEEKQRGLEMLRKASSRGADDEASKYLLQCYQNGSLPFSHHYFDLFHYEVPWDEELEALTTKAVFDKEKGKFQKFTALSQSVMNGFFALYKEKYGEDFEAIIDSHDMLYFRVILKYAQNVATIFLSTNYDEWKESFEKFLDVFTDKMRSADEIIAAAKLCGIEWAFMDKMDGSIQINGSEAVFFCTGKVNFRLIKNFSELKKVVITSIANGVKSVYYWEYFPLTSLEEFVFLPKHILNAEIYSYIKNARLQSVDTPALNVHDGFAFSVDGKTLIVLTDNTKTDFVIPETVETIKENAFKNADIQSVFIGDSVKSIESSAFENCSKITSVRLPSTLTAIPDYCFSECKKLERIDIPDSVKEIGDNAFSLCTALRSVDIPDSVVSLGKSAFFACKNLERAKISTNLTRINNETFLQCERLSSVSGMDNVKEILNSAFIHCTSLADIRFPKSLEIILDDAFSDCRLLSEITLEKSIRYIGKNALPETLTHLHYCGTDKQWAYINIENAYNRALIKILSTSETGILPIER